MRTSSIRLLSITVINIYFRNKFCHLQSTFIRKKKICWIAPQTFRALKKEFIKMKGFDGKLPSSTLKWHFNIFTVVYGIVKYWKWLSHFPFNPNFPIVLRNGFTFVLFVWKLKVPMNWKRKNISLSIRVDIKGKFFFLSFERRGLV